MNLRRTLPTYVAAVAALASALAASAQGGGGFGGPVRIGGGNPAVSNTFGLLQRSEVQNELHLDLKQKNALKDVQDQSGAEMQARMRQTMQGLQTGTPEERQARMQEVRDQIQTQVSQFQGEISEKVKSILKPEQIKRLTELDLQFRGPLAMVDSKVADGLRLSSDHKSQIQAIYASYNSQVQEVMQGIIQQMSANTPQGSVAPGQQPQGGQVRARLNALPDIGKKINPLKKTAEEKVLELLSPAEKASWTAAQGDKFTFRKDTPALGRPSGQ